MYLVNNAQLTRLPFFSRLFRPPGIFSPRISRLPLFRPLSPCPSESFRASRFEGNLKNSVDRGQRELTKSRSFDLMRARETGEIERESLRALTCACAHVRVTCIHVHYRPRSSSTFAGSRTSAPRFPADRARTKCNGGNREGWLKKETRCKGEKSGGFLWRPKWSSYARGDYARERNKERDKDVDL